MTSDVLETNVSGLREALRRLAILTEWSIFPPPQRWCPEAEQYDVTRLVRDLLDDEKLLQHLRDSGKNLGYWIEERLVGEAAKRL